MSPDAIVYRGGLMTGAARGASGLVACSGLVISGVLLGGAGAQPGIRHLAPISELRIGSDTSPDYILTTVGGIDVGRNGDIFVLQPREGLIRVYDVRGKFVRTIGRRGSGPGEFQIPRGTGWISDTLWVADLTQRRITFFASDGTLLKSTRMTQAFTRAAVGVNGVALATPGLSAQAAAKRAVERIPLLRLHAGTEDTLTMLDVRNDLWRIANDRNPTGRVAYRNQPFANSTLWQVSPDGRFVYWLDRSDLESTRAGAFSLVRARVDDGSIRRWSIPYRPSPVPVATVDSIVRSEVDLAMARSVFATRADAEAAIGGSLFVPRFWPPASDFIAGRDGTLWVEQTRDRGEASWIVIGPSGVVEGDLKLPPSTKLLQADQQTAWVVERDSLGVESVVRLALRERQSNLR